MIKINTTLQQPSGFSTDEAVLAINFYTLNKTVQISTGTTTMPIPTGGNQISINFSVFKSLANKLALDQPFQPVGFLYGISQSISDDDLVDGNVPESTLYNIVKAKLNADGYNTEWVEGGED